MLAAAVKLEFMNEVEVAELQRPALSPCDFPHAIHIIDDKSDYSRVSMLRYSGKSLFPSPGSFFAWYEQRIEEQRACACARLEGREIQDPRLSGELKTHAVGQKHERAAGQLVAMRLLDKMGQGATESVAEGRGR